MQLFIRHTTHYRFDQPVAHGLQQLRLKPRSGPGQSVIDWNMTLGGAQVSEKHTNFLINTGDATSTDIEALGNEVRRRVKDSFGVDLEWEIQRVGRS